MEILRIGTRVPLGAPPEDHPEALSDASPSPPVVHQHPLQPSPEITTEARQACGLLADHGIPLGCQTVLLRGVNDDQAVSSSRLMRGLASMRVRPVLPVPDGPGAGGLPFPHPHLPGGWRSWRGCGNRPRPCASPSSWSTFPEGAGVPLASREHGARGTLRLGDRRLAPSPLSRRARDRME